MQIRAVRKGGVVVRADRIRLCIPWCALPALLLLSGCAASDGSIVAEFDLDPCSDAIYVPVSCRGEDHLFLLDTGASLCVFDSSMRDQLGYPIGRDYVMTHSGEEAIELFNAPPLEIGERQLDRDEPVICQDLLSLQVALDEHITGILGMSFLEDYALELDVDTARLRILESPVADPAKRGHALHLDLEPHGGPELVVDVGDTGEWTATLDTGCSYFGAMEYEVCEDLLAKGLLTSSGISYTMTPHHAVASDLVVLDWMKVGPFARAGVVLTRSEGSVLGLPFFFGYNMVLDFPERVAYLEPRGAIAVQGYDSRPGLAVYYDNSGLVVSGVAPGGPAAASGVQVGDTILAIGEDPIGGAPLACVQEYFRSTSADSITLEIRRGTEQLTAHIAVNGGSHSRTRSPDVDAEQQPPN